MNNATMLATLPMTSADIEATNRLSCRRSAAEDHIDIKDISIRYGRNTVVDGVNLRVPRNAVTALIGPSGCGKSSILYCLNRLSDLIPCCKVTGSVSFSWLDTPRLNNDPILLRRQVGMLFQRPNPFPFSIRKNLAFALEQHGIKARSEVADRIESALQEVGLWDEVRDRLDAPALALSGGQQQRMCLARALVLEPSVLLMDEPCSALDPISTQKIESLVLQLAERRTIILVTHSLGQARRVADQVALFWKLDGDAGRLVERGHASEVFERPQHALTRAYLQYA